MRSASLFVLLALGCGSKEQAPPPRAEVRKPAVAAPAPPPVDAAPIAPKPKPTWSAPQPAGPLYVAFRERPLMMIDSDGTPKRVAGVPAVRDLHVASDGQAFASQDTGRTIRLYRLVGATAKALPALRTPSAEFSFNYYALDARGDDVVVAFTDEKGQDPKLARLADGKWTTESVDVEIGHISAVTTGRDDEVWIAGSKGFAVRRAGAWTMFACEANCYQSALGKVGDQVIGQTRSDGTIWRDWSLDGDKPKMRLDGAAVTWSSSGFGRNGTQLGLKSWEARVEYRHEATMPDFVLPPWNVGELAVLDGAGRAWLVADRRLAVIDLKTEAITTYPQRAFGIPADAINSLAVVGGGPALPATIEPRLAKTVTITLRVNGKIPTVGNALRICPHGAWRAADPCAKSQPAFAAKTDDKGTFTLTGVPAGTYDLGLLAHTSTGKVMWATAAGVLEIKAGDNVRLPTVSLELTEKTSYY
jgi:hypothetical protein